VADPKSSIAFEQVGLASILKQYRLKVPPNQREYSWSEAEVTTLLQDFAKAVNEGTDYFLGTIVTIPLEDFLEVVDGQQRLATVALFLAAIREYLRDKNEPLLIESINNEFLTGIDRDQRERDPNLTLNIDDNDLFKHIVADGIGTLPLPDAVHPSHERLINAYRLIERQITNIVARLDPNEHGNELNRWVSFIQWKALVILLQVPDDSDAYKMFETLNDRGLRTSQADLIKNYLFGRSGKRITETQKCWTFMRGTLETLDDDDITINFLRHALTVMRGSLTAAEVYGVVQGLAKSEQGAVTLVGQLEQLAQDYVASFNPADERWNPYPRTARSALELFLLFRIRPIRALLLAITSQMDIKAATASFEFLVSLGVRLLVSTTVRSGSVEVPLNVAAREVYSGAITSATQLKEQLAALTPSDQQFEQAFAIASVSNTRIARYYLRSLEKVLVDEPEPWFEPQEDQSLVNLEHVVPLRLEGNWPGISEDDVKIYGKRLGNMVLLRASDNSYLRSGAFADKRPVYEQSPYRLTEELGARDDWTVASIVERQARLAKLAVRAWPAL
jgi:hypothetical protein